MKKLQNMCKHLMFPWGISCHRGKYWHQMSKILFDNFWIILQDKIFKLFVEKSSSIFYKPKMFLWLKQLFDTKIFIKRLYIYCYRFCLFVFVLFLYVQGLSRSAHRRKVQGSRLSLAFSIRVGGLPIYNVNANYENYLWFILILGQDFYLRVIVHLFYLLLSHNNNIVWLVMLLHVSPSQPGVCLCA